MEDLEIGVGELQAQGWFLVWIRREADREGERGRLQM
jgi:hypothetical protein